MFCGCCINAENGRNNPKRKPRTGRFPISQKLAHGIMKCRGEGEEESLSLDLAVFNMYEALLIAAECGFS